MESKSHNSLSLVVVYFVLLALVAGTVITSRWHLGRYALAVALAFAAAKTVLIFTRFMHLREEHSIVRLFAVAGFFWLFLALGLTLSDYVNR